MADFNVLNPRIQLDFNRLVPGRSANYSALILKSEPVLYYRFQERSGSTTARDSSGHLNNGQYTVDGILYELDSPLQGDKQDASIYLDGGFITTSGSPTLNQAFTELTVEMWVRITGLMPDTEKTLVGRGAGPGPNNFQLSIIPDGRIKFWFAQAGAQTLAYSDSPLVPNNWYHVAATWDGQYQKVFLNGYEGFRVTNTVAPGFGTEDLQVGAYNNASRLEAYIDEVALYRRALPREEIITRPPFHKWNNVPPLITATTANGVGSNGTLTVYQGQEIELITTATDPDGDSLLYQFSLTGYVPEYGPQPENSITITYPEVGTYVPVAFVSDGLAVRSAPFAKIVVERVPDLQAFNDFYTTGFQRSIILNVLDNDVFPTGDYDVIDSWTQPEHGVLELRSNKRSFRYTPDPEFQDAADSFEYTITNGQGAFDTATVTVDVAPKQPPSINDISYYVGLNREALLRPTTNDVADPPSQVVTIVDVQNPSEQGGVVVLDAGTNRISYTPPLDYHGPDSFVYQAEDEDGMRGSATVYITVTEEAQVPFRASNDSYTVDYQTPTTLRVLNNDSTPYPEPLVISSFTQPSGGAGVVTANADDTALIFDPAPRYAGTTTFEYTMTDGSHQDTATVTVRVRNDPPRPGTIRKSTRLNEPLILDVIGPAYDREGEEISLRSFEQPSTGSVALDSDGVSLVYTPDTGFRGIDSFKYVIEDELGQGAEGTAYVAVDFTMSITVGPRSLPVTDRISYSVTVTAQSGYDKSYSYRWDFGDGSTSRSRTGTYRFSGIGTFEVSCTVTDSYGVERTLTETVEVGANRPPVANDYYASVAEGKVLSVDPRENDFDPDGDRFFLVPYQGPSDRGGQVATDTAGTPNNPYDDFFRYTHPPNLTESPFEDSFVYSIEDEYGLQAQATVYITVLTNQPPVALNIYRPVIYNTPTAIQVLDHVTDPEGDALFVTGVRDEIGGRAEIKGVGPSNYVIFTPEQDFLGQAYFVYDVQDSFQNPASAEVTVPVFGQHYPKKVYDDEPIAFWPLNEASGPQVYDMMVGQRTGTYINQVGRNTLGPLAKDMENAANVDRGSINLPTRNLGVTDQFTLELWFKITRDSSDTIIQGILTVAADGTRYDYRHQTSDGSKTLSLYGRELGEWYHLVVTYDGAWVRVYIDGEVLASSPHTGNMDIPNNLVVGSGMSGQVSMVAIYDKELSSSQVNAHYQEALGPVVSYDIKAPDSIDAGAEAVVTVKGRDVTGKTVKTENTRTVTMTSDDPSIKFDSDLDGNYE